MNEQEPGRSRAASAPAGRAALPADATATSAPIDAAEGPGLIDPEAVDTSVRSPAQRSRTFAGILVNTALANITTSYL